MYTLTLETTRRPLVIRRADGSQVFALKGNDRRFAEEILANLNR